MRRPRDAPWLPYVTKDPRGGHPIDDPVVFIDLDAALVELRPSGRPKPDLVLRPHAREGLYRLSEGARAIVLVDPAGRDALLAHQRDVREQFLRRHARSALARMPTFSCTHGAGTSCACRKPGLGLIEQAREDLGIDLAGGWIVGAEPDIQAGREAGLRTIHLGPSQEAPGGPIASADYDARDLLDAANWILLREALPAA